MDLFRQMDIVKEEALEAPIVVIGCGGIGSFVILALAKMGCSTLTIYDDDRVEEHNIPNQLYRLEDIGRPKVEALAGVVKAYTGLSLEARPERFDGQRPQGMVISAVDSMQARRRIWDRSVRYRAGVPLYIDARMGAEVARIYTVQPADPDDVRFYEATLHGDEEALRLPCTAQAIIYTGFSIAGLIANQVKKFVMGEALKREIIFDHKTLTLVAS
ncbi:MAG: ThiF family adenylyltransferase [candidate division NC10 bacterium]|nr:ThiF family adenylyltransferase [candidate division NC10 bacterium]